MAVILCFDKNLPETGIHETSPTMKVDVLDDQTYEVATSKIIEVDRDTDSPAGTVTIYLEEKDGRVWYLVLDTEELDRIKSVD